MIKKPLLAGTVDLSKLKYPVICSPKLDGIRCLIVNGKALTRSFKPIPNNHIRNSLEQKYKSSSSVFDGEIVIDGLPFNEISSAVMSEEGSPNFRYIRFDCVNDIKTPYYLRLQSLRGNDVIHSDVAHNQDDLLELEQEYLAQGYEGLMIRDPEGIYKEGRSTTSEQILLKLKKFEDSEAVIVGFEEQMKNENELKSNEAGKNLRGRKKENLHPKDTLGSLIVEDCKTGVVFNVSTGFSDELRKEIWEKKDQYLGELIKYKYQSHGTVRKPRCPVFVGFRSTLDL
ncbi:MAG TPA: hypothetical protein VGD26_03235 [Chitinophagaceae bacterium]